MNCSYKKTCYSCSYSTIQKMASLDSTNSLLFTSSTGPISNYRSDFISSIVMYSKNAREFSDVCPNVIHMRKTMHFFIGMQIFTVDKTDSSSGRVNMYGSNKNAMENSFSFEKAIKDDNVWCIYLLTIDDYVCGVLILCLNGRFQMTDGYRELSKDSRTKTVQYRLWMEIGIDPFSPRLNHMRVTDGKKTAKILRELLDYGDRVAIDNIPHGSYSIRIVGFIPHFENSLISTKRRPVMAHVIDFGLTWPYISKHMKHSEFLKWFGICACAICEEEKNKQ